MERSVRAVTVATFVLRFATGLTGALLIFFLADFAEYGGPEVGPFVVGVFTALFFAAELVLSPPFGLLSDRVGHHRVMQIGPLFGLGGGAADRAHRRAASARVGRSSHARCWWAACRCWA